ncbi:hypothetical protein ACE1B6_01615 [Aerosakkonemataceae cyanobacterium BLCC-F154]|uniref:Uncharacterized protein n=1 Tax=Floridaenema fluviatile BLCC-F154 TaxID=3153640 RepID=A0ABV4Y629_9CYAN
MKHPFDLDPAELELIDLDFSEPLTDEQNAPIGGAEMTTMAIGEEGGTTEAFGEEGGDTIVCISAPCPGSESGDHPDKPIPIDPPFPTTTKALNEEGGSPYTKALFEAGGFPICW